MHPAKSVILFTTFSGAGYGLLIMLMLGQLTGFYEASLMVNIIAQGIAFTLITIGLLSSTFHLGHPERAWRALSQWRSSWLSREGLSSLITYAMWFIYALFKFVLPEQANTETMTNVFALATLIMAMSTVYTTSMIYRSLKAVQSWYNLYVSPLYLLFSITSGLVLLNVILHLAQSASSEINQLALVTLIALILLKRGYWRFVDKAPRRSTIESATGLGKFGQVIALESPHSHQNYLMAEMGFQVARKHSKKLRQIFSVLLSLSIVFIGIIAFAGLAGTLSALLSLAGCLALAVAIAVERWLFFAEARHDQALFYGQ